MMTKRYEFRGRVFNVACVDRMACDPSWFSMEDEAVVRDRFWQIGPNDVVFDVGAAYGSYTLTALAAGATRVYAWAPMEDGIVSGPDFLEESLRRNGWQDRCEVARFGAYNRTGWVNTDTQEFHVERPMFASKNVIEVQKLDDWRLKHVIPSAPVYWLKLDVEGAEVQVLYGAQLLLSEFTPRVLVENHNFKRATLEQEVRDFLTQRGYREVATAPYHAVSHSLYVPR